MKRGTLVVLVVLVAASGCTAVTSPDRPSLPYVTDGEVTNESATLTLHQRALSNQSYVLEYETWLERRGERAAPLRRHVTYEHATGEARVHVDADHNTTLWTDGNRSYRRNERNGVVRYATQPPPSEAVLTQTAVIEPLFAGTNFSVAGTVDCGEETCLELTPTGPLANDSRALDATLAVSGDGVVRRVNVTIVDQYEGENITTRVTMRVTPRSVDVTRPAWVGDAAERTGPTGSESRAGAVV